MHEAVSVENAIPDLVVEATYPVWMAVLRPFA
jgi:hypothetical protein